MWVEKYISFCNFNNSSPFKKLTTTMHNSNTLTSPEVSKNSSIYKTEFLDGPIPSLETENPLWLFCNLWTNVNNVSS